MNPRPNLLDGPAPKPHRRLPKGAAIRRYVFLLVVAAVSTGCANDVVMTNPQTGKTETCQESMGGLDPWSQTMACVAGHEAQGWTRAGEE